MISLGQRIWELSKSRRFVLALRFFYLACLLYIVIFWRAIWTPDVLFIMLLFVFLLYGQARQYFVSFGPFLLLLVTYDSLRSLVPFVSKHVHFVEMIDFDRWLFGGTLPTTKLQALWYHGHLVWYDYYFYFVYMCHFLFPLVAALIIWRWGRAHYARFVVAFLILSYMGFLTYLAFPAAPPWMASEMGLIPPLHKISTDVWWSVGVHDFPSIYRTFSPNLVAAVPSLHAAYPTMIALFIYRAFGWKAGLATLWYPLTIWVGVVYMGEHYVFDVIVGVLYVFIAYFLTLELFKRYGYRVRGLHGRLKERYHSRRKAAVVGLSRVK